jgi:ComF family protein
VLQAYCLLHFEGAPRALIHALKYGRRTSAASALVRAVLPGLGELPLRGVDVVVPVPLHAVRLRERGFNQAALLAAGIAGALGRPVRNGLRRTRATREQTGLARAERLSNVADAFAPEPVSLRAARVLLVDDVVTTGATLGAAADALAATGVESIFCLALAGRAPDARAAARGRGAGRAESGRSAALTVPEGARKPLEGVATPTGGPEVPESD